MSEETTRNSSGGGGCLTMIILALIALALLSMAGGGKSTPTTTTTDTRSGVLSGNQTEILSRNQFNLLSDVWNCFGDNSCIITSEIMTETTTSTTNAPVNVDGDRNVVSGGLHLCVDAAGMGYQTNQPCGEGYQEQQP